MKTMLEYDMLQSWNKHENLSLNSINISGRPQRDEQYNGVERNRLLREKLNAHSRKSV